jgi:hypothetical protein
MGIFRSIYSEVAKICLSPPQGIPDAQADQVDTFMQQRAREMIRSGLNAGSKPAEQAQQDTGEEERDQFNEQTADGLRQLLSPALADKVGIDPQLMEFLETDFDKTSQSGPILKPSLKVEG